jgi:hypothetical protein
MKSIDDTVSDFRSRDTSKDVFGYNDCYTFVRTYEHNLRGFNLLPRLEYTDNKSFVHSTKDKGFRGLAIEANFQIITNGFSQTGDVGVMLTRNGDYTTMINHNGIWITAAGTLGIVSLRRVRIKETQLILLCRAKGINNDILLQRVKDTDTVHNNV